MAGWLLWSNPNNTVYLLPFSPKSVYKIISFFTPSYPFPKRGNAVCTRAHRRSRLLIGLRAWRHNKGHRGAFSTDGIRFKDQKPWSEKGTFSAHRLEISSELILQSSTIQIWTGFSQTVSELWSDFSAWAMWFSGSCVKQLGRLIDFVFLYPFFSKDTVTLIRLTGKKARSLVSRSCSDKRSLIQYFWGYYWPLFSKARVWNHTEFLDWTFAPSWEGFVMSSDAISTLWHQQSVTSLWFYSLAKSYCTIQSSFGSVRFDWWLNSKRRSHRVHVDLMMKAAVSDTITGDGDGI